MKLLRCSKDQTHAGEEGPWGKIVAATVIGSAHERKNQLGQDAYAIGIENEWLVAVVCDGAGSVPHGGDGALLCAEGLANSLLCDLETVDPDQLSLETIDRFVTQRVEQIRKEIKGDLHEYAATLIGAVISAKDTHLFHVGDGAAVAVPVLENVPQWQEVIISQPQNGEYINETYFFTDPGWHDHLRMTACGRVGRVALMTDGVTSFALSSTATVAERFMVPVFRHLQETEADHGSRALYGTLRSAKARLVSDDDKTFVYIQCP